MDSLYVENHNEVESMFYFAKNLTLPADRIRK